MQMSILLKIFAVLVEIMAASDLLLMQRHSELVKDSKPKVSKPVRLEKNPAAHKTVPSKLSNQSNHAHKRITDKQGGRSALASQTAIEKRLDVSEKLDDLAIQEAQKSIMEKEDESLRFDRSALARQEAIEKRLGLSEDFDDVEKKDMENLVHDEALLAYGQPVFPFGGPDPTPAPTPLPTTAPTPSPTTAPTPSPTTCEEAGTCSIYEDPHIKVFDGVQISLLGKSKIQTARVADYGAGDMWFVRSSEVSIQGKYLPDPDLPDKSLFVRAIAVGGPFMDGNTLIVGPLSGEVTWNGRPILDTQTSDFTSVVGRSAVRLQRHFNSHLVQDMTQTNPGVDIDLPLGVKLTVNRYKSHVNVFIEMPPAEGGQDGLCGNFNCHSGDDTLDMILKTRSPQVLTGESLFKE